MMLPHDSLRDGKVLPWRLSSARASVPMEAGGRCRPFYNKAWEVTQSHFSHSVLVEAVTNPRVENQTLPFDRGGGRSRCGGWERAAATFLR